METAAAYQLKCYGAPYAVRSDDPAQNKISLQRSLSWCLLARLQDNAILTREQAYQDLSTEDQSLTKAISDCRKAFGKECIPKTSGKVSLKSGCFSSDTAEFDALKQRADAAMYAERIALYTQAFALVTGEFLAGCVNINLHWLEKRNSATAAVGYALIDHWQQEKHPRQALEIAEQLAAALPRDTQLTDKVLRLRLECSMETAPAPHSPLAEWTHFVRDLAKKQHRLTTTETEVYHQALQCRFDALSDSLRTALRKLSILQGSFGADMADGICGVYAAELSLLSATPFLTQCAGRYEVPPVIREWTFAQNPPSQKDALQTAYHGWIIEAFCSQLLFDWHITPEQCVYWKQNLSYLDAALSALIDTIILPTKFALNSIVTFCMRSASVFLPHHVPKVYELFVRYLAEMDTSHPVCYSLHQYSGRLASSMRQYTVAAQHFQGCLEMITHDETLNVHSCTLTDYLHSLHHGGKVSEAVNQIAALLPRLREDQNVAPLCELLHLYAESLYTLGRFEESCDACTEALQLASIQSPPRPPASILYHQGMALAGRNERDEALAAFDASLESFTQLRDEQGQADCWQQMGKMHAEKGQHTQGKRMVEEALRLYADMGKDHSRAACLRSLGDVLKIKGDIEDAKAAYCEGLAFWEAQGHSAWIERFQERLDDLTEEKDEENHGRFH